MLYSTADSIYMYTAPIRVYTVLCVLYYMYVLYVDLKGDAQYEAEEEAPGGNASLSQARGIGRSLPHCSQDPSE